MKRRTFLGAIPLSLAFLVLGVVLLSQRPDVAGFAASGMPLGSPGMGDDPTAKYEVFAVSRDPSAAPADYYRAGTEG